MTSTSRKPWTLLAYTVADDKATNLSPLDRAVKEEIKAICDAADMTQMHVAAQVDFKRTPGVFRATLKTHRARDFEDVSPEKYDLWREILQRAEESDLVVQKERRDLNAAKWGVLSEFLHWGREECPADRYVVFFYGHSFGPMGMFYDADSTERIPRALRLNDLARALRSDQGPAEVVMFRDCFMGTLETAFELHGVARFMIASQSEMPIAGRWPWTGLMSAMMGTADSLEIARGMSWQMATHFNQRENRGPLSDVPCSLIDIEAAYTLGKPFKDLVDALQSARADQAHCATFADAFERARIGSPANHERPGDPSLLDLPTLCDNLRRLAIDPVSSLAGTTGDALNKGVIKYHHSQKDHFRGLSVYYRPVKAAQVDRTFIGVEDAKSDDLYYESLAFSRATGWNALALHPLGT
jgi:hypothetical protein